MYVTSYKLNNSYTTYVVRDGEEDTRSYPVNALEWKCGAKVIHCFHGKGIIRSIDNHKITVFFKQSKAFRKFENIHVTFEFQNHPNEWDNLRLCY